MHAPHCGLLQSSFAHSSLSSRCSLGLPCQVPREIVGTDQLLPPARALVSELRWLQLKLASRKCSLQQVKKMRAERGAGQRDLELPYHPLLLHFFQAASRGQQGLEFLAEDHSLPKPREDIRGLVEGKRLVPQECKSDCVYNPDSADPTSARSIDANSEAIGKLLQVRRPPRKQHAQCGAALDQVKSELTRCPLCVPIRFAAPRAWLRISRACDSACTPAAWSTSGLWS
jgi:hypothetical protein